MNLPLGQSLAGGIKHTAGCSVNEADFAAQHFHQITLLTSGYLHFPQVIGVA